MFLFRVFCHYELNGVCNDKNCPNYHQKDYESAMDETNSPNNDANHEDVREVASNEIDPFLVSFADFRKRITPRWPVLTTDHSASKVRADGFNLWRRYHADMVVYPHADCGER
jgi:hypothetical protein